MAQAMVVMDGQHVRAMYLGGGKTLKAAGATIERNESGLAYVERVASGSYVVGNPSADKATVTVTLPGVTERTPVHSAAQGRNQNRTDSQGALSPAASDCRIKSTLSRVVMPKRRNTPC